VRTSSDIKAAQIGDLNELLSRIWKDGGGSLFGVRLNATKTRGTASYVNIYDSSYAAYNAIARGFWVWLEKMGSYESNNVPCVFWANANRAAGASAVNVRLVGSAGTLATLTFNAGGSEYQTATFNLDASQVSQKLDVLYQGNGTANSCELYSFGAYQYIA
jgi:hypothetical protein